MALGFVLVGGNSTRMRRPKALLPWYHQPLFHHLVNQLATVCNAVFLVGQPRPEYHPFTVLEDVRPGCGPLGGIAAALRYEPSPGVPANSWRLVLSCDCPFVTGATLQRLVAAAIDARDVDIVVPETEGGNLHPLCSLWHERLRGPLLELIEGHWRNQGEERSQMGVQRFLRRQRLLTFPVHDPSEFRNVNTMKDYLAALGGHALR